MNPIQTLNPIMLPVAVPVVVPVPVAVAVPMLRPMVARRVQQQQAKKPSTMETVSKVVDGVSQLVGLAKKYFGGTTSIPSPVARRAMPAVQGTAETELLPESAFGPEEDCEAGNWDDGAISTGAGGDWGTETGDTGVGGDWGSDVLTQSEPVPQQGWDWNSMMGGFDPNQMIPGFDANQTMGGMDPNSGW